MLFYFLAFLLLALRDRDTLGFILCVSVPLLIFLGTTLLPRLFPTDRLLMSLTNFLCALGVLILYDTKPDYAIQQVLAYGVGLGGMLFCIYLVRMSRGWGRITTIIMPMALAFLAFPLLFGKEINGAQNWIVLGSLSFQPSEIVKPALVICLSWRMSSRQHLVWVLFGTLCLLLLALQRDFGTALIYFLSTILLFWCSTGHLPLTLLGLAAGGGAAWWGYQHFAHVRRRVAIWLNPWRDSENAAASWEPPFRPSYRTGSKGCSFFRASLLWNHPIKIVLTQLPSEQGVPKIFGARLSAQHGQMSILLQFLLVQTFHSLNQANQTKTGDKRCPAIGDEGQRYTGERDQLQDAADN